MAKVREAIFSMLEARGTFWPKVNVLDLFAGSGSLGIEALSRNAPKAWFVEKGTKQAKLISQNLLDLAVPKDRYRVINKQVNTFLSFEPCFSWDIIFIDPPYGQNMLIPTLLKLEANNWLSKDTLILAEIEASCQLSENKLSFLTKQIDKLYGQTRILLWTFQNI
jgi:16S rRNA (guanine966-N2)-methyltransferase